MALTNATGLSVGVGVVAILAGVVFVVLDSSMWPSAAFLIVFGIGLSVIGILRKATLRVSLGFLAAALVFLAIWLAMNIP